MEARRGDTEQYTLTITVGGTEVDLTGSTLWFTVKVNEDDKDDWAVIRKQTGSGIENADQEEEETLGKAVLTLSAEDTQYLSVQDYVYDVQYKAASGDITTVEQGTFTVTTDVTRATS
jgi:hypothetical protein